MTEFAATFTKRYVLEQELGSGGFAKVYRARQISTAQEVAVKILQIEERTGGSSIEHQLERFRRETRLCAELHHPNIISLIDSGQTEQGLLYVVFALVPGRNLALVLREEGALEPWEALHLMTQVMDAISCAHQRGIVHRDLKPENIMVSATGARRNAMVLDFGIGSVAVESQLHDLERVTQTGEYLGTPAYSAPEQLRGAEPMLASDLYSWGLIFLECLTGVSAFGQVSSHELLHRQLNSDPVPIPDALLRSALGDILARVTQKDVSCRNAVAGELLVDLQGIERSHLPQKKDLTPAKWGEPTHRAAAGGVPSPRALVGDRWLVPLGRNPNFVGRRALLSAIDSLLETSLLAIVALHGLGGVGKSQVALEFAYRHAADYRLIAWIRSESAETLAADYAAIAPSVGVPLTPDQRQSVESVRHWLERNEGWLMVFDNAPDPAALRQYLPRSHGGHILITSRHHSWRNLAASVPVPVLTPQEAASFLVHRTGDTDELFARQLGTDLGQLPLALEEAAAYIEATGRTIASYISLFRSHRERLLLGGADAGNNTLRMTWELSFRAVEQDGTMAADMLKICAFLAPDDVPYQMFRPKAGGPLPGFGAKLGDDVALDVCIATLRRYSLVHTEVDAFSIHRLVQMVTRERLSEQERERFAVWALELVEAAYPINAIAGDVSPQAGRLLPHALAALSNLPDLSGCAVTAARILRRTGTYMSARGLHVSARDHLLRAHALFEGAGGVTALEVGGVLWELGLVLHALGEARQARGRLENALALLRNDPSAEAQLLCAQTLIGLAWVLRTLGEFEAALAAASACCSLARARSGNRHAVVPMSLALMARAEWGLNRFPAARDHMREAVLVLAELEHALPLVCGTWYMLAQLHYDLGDLDTAAWCANKGTEIGVPAYGRDHALVALNVCIDGMVRARRGDVAGARELLLAAAESGDRTCTYPPEELALARVELANLTRGSGDPGKASVELSQVLAQRSRYSENRTRFEGVCLISLARCSRELGDLDQAEAHCRAGLDAIAGVYGQQHPLCMQGFNQLGWICYARGHAEGALSAFAESLRIGEAAALTTHVDYLEAAEGTRVSHQFSGDHAAAPETFVRALDGGSSLAGGAHAVVGLVHHRLSEGGN